MLSVFIPMSRPRSIPRPVIRIPLTPRLGTKRTPEPLPVYMDELEKAEMAKTRPIPENTWYHWYGWLINHVPESMKKSESDTKQEVMILSESKIDNNGSDPVTSIQRGCDCLWT